MVKGTIEYNQKPIELVSIWRQKKTQIGSLVQILHPPPPLPPGGGRER